MLMQNLVLAAQNDVPAAELGAATSVLSFFRSMGGTIGTSVLGAVLANRVATEMARGLEDAGVPAGAGRAPGGGEGGVPDVAALPGPVRAIVEHAYGVATADLFLVATPFALLALIAVVFLKEKPLKTTSGMERLAEETGGPTGRAADGAPESGREPAAPVG
jgi:hypothetical protein